jgi:Cdc6-like AAA superfamily ATPase
MSVAPTCDVGRGHPPGNPFSTRHVRPGRIAPLDGRGEPLDLEALLERLEKLGGSAAIRGPHGSGKTTLLEHLSAALQDRGIPVVRVRLRTVGDTATVFRAILHSPPGAFVCIDSWDCLGRMPAAVVRLLARVRRCGLIVTTHKTTSLPLLARRDTTPELLAAIVRRLPGCDRVETVRIGPQEIDAAFTRSQGNLREALYELYDRFERLKRLDAP